eukprot:scaffold586_cov112-Skeletonema_dohrnii-CCMP3373.AAC.18
MRHFHPSLLPQVGSAVSVVAFEAGTSLALALALVRVAFSSKFSVGNFLTLSTPDYFFSDSRTRAWSSGFFHPDNKFLDSSFAAEAEEERLRGSRFTMKLCR